MAKLFLTAEGIVFVLLLALLVDAIRARSRAVYTIIISAVVLLVLVIVTIRAANARDLGQWEASDPTIRGWYQALMQPDNPAVPCCGEADAYWADSYEVTQDGEYVAIITDERPDEPLRRKHFDVGTKIVIPQRKLKYDQSNPTGHGIVFLSSGGAVFCYVAPGGV